MATTCKRGASWDPTDAMLLLKIVEEHGITVAKPMEGVAAKARRAEAWLAVTNDFSKAGHPFVRDVWSVSASVSVSVRP